MTRLWVVSLALLACVSAVKRQDFKTCEQSGFCKRHRALTENTGYELLRDSVKYSGSKLTGTLQNADNKLALRLFGLKDSSIRIQIDETEAAIRKRFVPEIALNNEPEQLVFSNVELKADSVHITTGDKKLKVVIAFKPFVIEVYNEKSELVAQVNRDGKLKVEEYRVKEDGKEYPENFWEETFKSFRDSKPFGSSSVGIDISFIGFPNAYGLPEHADAFALKTTKGNTDPFRLYNLDVFEYELNNPMALYVAIPYIVAHKKNFTVGALWLNAAETWIDTSSSVSSKGLFRSVLDKVMPGQEVPHFDAHFMSETGLIDVFFFGGPSPKDVQKQLSRVSGVTPIPPLFSIAYHQCRWNYNDEQDVEQVNSNFDLYDIPMDVIWLDIEHTDGKKYFTWDEHKFAHPKEMIDKVAAKGRKMVTIIDPHIKKDDSYPIYKDAKDLGLYVKKADGQSDFEGHCWPGSSAYLDFLKPETRAYWAAQFAFDRYTEISLSTLSSSRPMAEDKESCTAFEECPECGTISRGHLYRHLRMRHDYSTDMIEKLKEEKRNQRVQASYFYSCEACSKPFPSIRALRSHEKSVHDDYLRPGTIRCPSCEAVCKNHVALVAHAQDQHSKSEDEFIVERLFFRSKDEYEEWRNIMDDTSLTTLSVSSVKHQRGDRRRSYLRCSFASVNQRQENRSVTKCNVSYCTAFMKITESNSGVEVEYCLNHLGHETTSENATLRLDKKSVDYIVQLLKDGFVTSQIIRKIRSEFGCSNPRSRIYYTTTRDIRKISERHGIIPGRMHSNDIISVEARVARNDYEDGIQYYRGHSDETGDGFAMVIITPTQQQWLQKYGRRGVCIDDTFNLTGYNLRVAVVVLVNEWDMGVPGGYLLSFRMTAKEVRVLFAEVRKVVPDFEPAFFMSDDTNTFYNGFVQEFPETQSVKLLCAFHVVQAVLRNANSKLREKSLVPFVKKEMSTLCYTRVESEFNDRYRKLLMTLKGKDESEMLHYLENNWSGRVTQWAGFARIWSPFNTSMMVERFHKRLKYENRGRVGNSRLDSIVHSLINIPAVLAHDFEIRMRRRLSYGRHRFAEQLNAHKAGMKALHDAQLQVLVTDKGWEVRSGRTYFIEQKQCECDPALNNHCTRDGCGACAYAYCCTCNGDGKAGVCCLHIHAAIVAHPEGRQFRFPPEDGNDNIHSACDVDVNNNVDVDNFVVEPEVDIVGNNKENVEETDRMDRNKDNIQKIEMLCSQIKSISLEIAKKPDACDVLDDVVVNMQQIYQQLAARTEQRAPLNRRFELNTVGPIKKDVPIRLLSRKAAKKSNHDLSSSH